jgi:hypothetical protein
MPTEDVKRADPTPILQTAFGFWSSKVLLTAVEMGVFSMLGSGRPTGAELGQKLGLHPRGIADFFDAPEALRTGRPQNEVKHSQKPIFEELYRDLPKVEQSGDSFEGPSPRADPITMGMILHDWNLEKKKHLIRSAFEALPEGGALVAIEALIDDERRENVQALLMSLNMLIEFGDAFDFTGADFEGWCREAGFTRSEVISLAGASSAAVAWK